MMHTWSLAPHAMQVVLLAIYVNEFGADAPPPNTGRIYVECIDGVPLRRGVRMYVCERKCVWITQFECVLLLVYTQTKGSYRRARGAARDHCGQDPVGIF